MKSEQHIRDAVQELCSIHEQMAEITNQYDDALTVAAEKTGQAKSVLRRIVQAMRMRKTHDLHAQSEQILEILSLITGERNEE